MPNMAGVRIVFAIKITISYMTSLWLSYSWYRPNAYGKLRLLTKPSVKGIKPTRMGIRGDNAIFPQSEPRPKIII